MYKSRVGVIENSSKLSIRSSNPLELGGDFEITKSEVQTIFQILGGRGVDTSGEHLGYIGDFCPSCQCLASQIFFFAETNDCWRLFLFWLLET